jgi:hypothetical protein
MLMKSDGVIPVASCYCRDKQSFPFRRPHAKLDFAGGPHAEIYFSFPRISFLSSLLQATVKHYIIQQCRRSAVGIATTLRSLVRIAVGARDVFLLQNVQTGTWAHPASYSMDTEVLSRGVNLTAHLHLVPRLRMSGAVPLLTLCAFMAWTRKTLPFLYNTNH